MQRCQLHRWITRGAFLAAALLGPTADVPGESGQSLPDGRILRVDAFFESYGCPAPNHAAEYVRAADQYQLDYRILPAISFLESTCGSYQRQNNYWGWNSAKTGFPTVASGIDYIARQLAWEQPYMGRTLDEKLYSYNPRDAYVRAAKRLMREIGP